MKCVVNTTTDQVIRVSDDQAKRLIATGMWKYIGKQIWKQRGRMYGGPAKSSE